MKIKRFESPSEVKYVTEEIVEEPITDADVYNESREGKLVKRYRSILNLDECCEITEENLDEWALRHASNLEGLSYDRSKAALLGKKFEGYNG